MVREEAEIQTKTHQKPLTSNEAGGASHQAVACRASWSAAHWTRFGYPQPRTIQTRKFRHKQAACQTDCWHVFECLWSFVLNLLFDQVASTEPPSGSGTAWYISAANQDTIACSMPTCMLLSTTSWTGCCPRDWKVLSHGCHQEDSGTNAMNKNR